MIPLTMLRFHHNLFPPLQSTQLRATPIRDALVHTTFLCSDAARITFPPISTHLANFDDCIDSDTACAAAMAFEQ